jgi:hypothetical protein
MPYQVNITHDYTNCCLYRVDPPHDEQQACSKQVENYYWNKLIENSASCWFILYGYITMHSQQNFKKSPLLYIPKMWARKRSAVKSVKNQSSLKRNINVVWFQNVVFSDLTLRSWLLKIFHAFVGVLLITEFGMKESHVLFKFTNTGAEF